jgi:hypothetical protein
MYYGRNDISISERLGFAAAQQALEGFLGEPSSMLSM